MKVASLLLLWTLQDGRPLPQLDDIINRMEAVSTAAGTKTAAWRVFSRSGAREFTQELGLEVLGRFERGVGLRTVATTLACADAGIEARARGANHYVTVYARDHLTVAPIMLLIESPNPEAAFPYLAFRARRGDPSHTAVEPMLAPASLTNVFFANDEATMLQLAPRIMLDHQPHLQLTGRARFNNTDCFVLLSERQTNLEEIPSAWYIAQSLTKRIYVNAATFLVEGLDYQITRRTKEGTARDVWLAHVKERQNLRGLALPKLVAMRRVTSSIAHLPSVTVERTIQLQDEDFP